LFRVVFLRKQNNKLSEYGRALRFHGLDDRGRVRLTRHCHVSGYERQRCLRVCDRGYESVRAHGYEYEREDGCVPRHHDDARVHGHVNARVRGHVNENGLT